MLEQKRFIGREISSVSRNCHVVRLDSEIIKEFDVGEHVAGLDHESGDGVTLYLCDRDRGDLEVKVRDVGNSLGFTLEAGICRVDGIDDETLANHEVVDDDPDAPVVEFTFQRPRLA